MHGLHYMELGEAHVRHFHVYQTLRNHAHRLAAGGQNRVCYHAHQAYFPAAVHQLNSFLREQSS